MLPLVVISINSGEKEKLPFSQMNMGPLSEEKNQFGHIWQSYDAKWQIGGSKILKMPSEKAGQLVV